MAKKEKKERERYLPSVEDKDLPSVEDEIRDSNLSIRAFYWWNYRWIIKYLLIFKLYSNSVDN